MSPHLDDSIRLSIVAMILAQNRFRLFQSTFLDQPSRAFRTEECADNDDDWGNNLKKEGEPPRPGRRHLARANHSTGGRY